MDAEKAVQFLVKDKDGKGRLPYTKDDGKPDHRLMGAAWAALHGGYRGQKYQGPDKDAALAKLKKIYKEEKMELPSEKAAAALIHLMALKGHIGKDGEPEKHATFAIKSCYESPVDDPEPGLFVEGILAAEEPDFEGEIMDYKSSKPNFQRWNKNFADMTGGKSVGNLRGQHNPKIAAGKFVTMEYDDDKLSIPVLAKVVDPVEADKVRQGVYTSFSIGAHYARKWRDPGGKGTRWTADPFEGSVVDFGSIPTTRGFTYRAADGHEEQREFDGGRRQLRKAFEAYGKPLSIDEEDRVVKAITGMGAAKKGLYTISGFAQLVQELIYMRDSITFEKEMEGDASPVTDRVAEATEELLECLAAYTQEQVSEEIGKTKENTVELNDLAKDIRIVKTAAADNADGKPTPDDVQKALDSVKRGMETLKAAGYSLQPGTTGDPGHSNPVGPAEADDKAAKKCDKSEADCDDKDCPDHGEKAKAAAAQKCDKTKEDCKDADCPTHKCMKSAENCDDEKCMTHKGKKSAAAGSNGAEALKRADVVNIVNETMTAKLTEFQTGFQKDVVGPLSESLKTISETMIAIGEAKVPTAIKARPGTSVVTKDAESNKEAEDAQKAIEKELGGSKDPTDGRGAAAMLRIRQNPQRVSW
jgi:hypothetical protein